MRGDKGVAYNVIKLREEKMDIKDLARTLGLQICQKIREFEQQTGMEVSGFKIKRDEHGIESVTVKVEFPDMD